MIVFLQSTTYKNVVNEHIEKFGFSIEKYHIQNRLKTLKMNFNTCLNIFKGLSSFSRNLKTKLFDAEPEVWNDLINDLSLLHA